MHNDWQRQLARAITKIESNDPQMMAQVAGLPLDNDKVHIIGVTGPPGGGKSTLCSQILQHLARDQKVAAILVDPSSPHSGGAILGDRIRMQALAANQNIYIRSLSNRGNTGGVSRSLVSILRLLISYDFEYILIETIGAGQSEVKIASIADTTLVVAVPNLGDDIQAFKSGILEVADVLVINKADLPGVDSLYTDLRESAQRTQQGWVTPICQTVAVKGHGVQELLDIINKHKQWLDLEGRLVDKRKQAAKFEVLELSSWMLQQHLDKLPAEVLAANLTRGDSNLFQRLETAYIEIINSLSEV